MSKTDPVIQDILKIQRITHNFTEPPFVNGKPLGREDMYRLVQFITTLANQMDDNQHRRETPLTREELGKMLMASAKWSLEEFSR